MRVEIKKIKNNEVSANTVIEFDSLEEMETYVENINTIIVINKINMLDSGTPYVEIEEDGFTGFISDSFQYLSYGNYFEYTEGDETVQMTFILDSVNQAA